MSRCCQPEEVTGLDDYPLPPPLSGDVRIHSTVIKKPTICYEALPSQNHTFVTPPPMISRTAQVFRYENQGSIDTAFPNLWSADHRWSATMGEVVRR
jgi:hypothetical protein